MGCAGSDRATRRRTTAGSAQRRNGGTEHAIARISWCVADRAAPVYAPWLSTRP